MNSYREVLVSILSFLLLSTILPGQAVAQNDGVSAEDLARVDATKEIYHANCAACHGFDGTPGMIGVPNFAKGERLEKGDPELLVSMRDGKVTEAAGIAMPPWKGTLSEEEMRAVLGYLRVIKGDTVFQENCSDCHGDSVPPLADTIPRTVEKLEQYGEPFNLCKGLHVDSIMERQDIVSVIQFLLGVTKE